MCLVVPLEQQDGLHLAVTQNLKPSRAGDVPQSHRSETCMVPQGACAFPPHSGVHRPRRGLPDMALLCSLWGRVGFRPRLHQASWSKLPMPQPFPAGNGAELRTEWPVRSKMTAYEAVSNGFFFSRFKHFSLVWFGGQGLTI